MSPRLARLLVLSTALLAVPALSWAQLNPGRGGTVTPPTPEDKPDGVAEKAPAPPGSLPTTPALEVPKSSEKRFEAHEINGYFRFRGDWFKKFHLGFDDDPTVSGAPFRRPLACKASTAPSAGSRPCEHTLKSANIRLRLEPIIRVPKANATIKMQVDVLDNLVLGSTPDGIFYDGTPAPTNIPISAFSGSQAPPQVGRNSLTSSLVVKRAWAEVMTPLGLLKFGRMPSHWGLGILANGGGLNPFNGTYDYDSDYGDTVDRLLFGAEIPGTELRATVAMDWSAVGPTSGQTDIFTNRYDGQPWDLDDNDDVNQWIFAVTRLDHPRIFGELRAKGQMALNYGAYLVYRTQNWDSVGTNLGASPVPEGFVPRDAKAYIPDVWAHFALGDIELEFEGVAILGSIEKLNEDLNIPDELDIRQFGAVGRFHYRALDNDLKLSMEIGSASGDQWDANPQGSTNVRDARALPGEGDTTVSNFRFDFAYQVDLILFRELMGTVTNATYIKPSLNYTLGEFNFMGASIISFANKPIATPGNGLMYGAEFDADISYKTGNFSAGIAYGVLFPLGALDHPEDDPADGGPGFLYGTNVGDAEVAQTIQTRLILAF